LSGDISDCSGWGETIKENVNHSHPRAEVASRRRCAHHERDDDPQTIGNTNGKEGANAIEPQNVADDISGCGAKTSITIAKNSEHLSNALH